MRLSCRYPFATRSAGCVACVVCVTQVVALFLRICPQAATSGMDMDSFRCTLSLDESAEEGASGADWGKVHCKLSISPCAGCVDAQFSSRCGRSGDCVSAAGCI